MKTCFKKIDKSSNVYYRHVQFDNGTWGIADKDHVQTLFNQTFTDSDGKKHFLDEIANIGIDKDLHGKDNITVLYVFDAEKDDFNHNKKVSVNVTDPAEIKKIINYLNQTKCSK